MEVGGQGSGVCVCVCACRQPWLSQPCQGGGWTSVPVWECLGTGRATEAPQPSSFSNRRLSQLHGGGSSAAAALVAARVAAHGRACPSPCRPDEEAGPGVAGPAMSPDPTGPHRQAAGALRLALD